MYVTAYMDDIEVDLLEVTSLGESIPHGGTLMPQKRSRFPRRAKPPNEMDIVLRVSIGVSGRASNRAAFGVGWNTFIERRALKVMHQEGAETLARSPSRMPNRLYINADCDRCHHPKDYRF